MTACFDVDAYLGRIEWTGAARPMFHTLAALVRAHMSKIPFENLDVLLGRPIRLDFDGCSASWSTSVGVATASEHATLFAAILEAIGFKPARHSACVTLITLRDASPRTLCSCRYGWRRENSSWFPVSSRCWASTLERDNPADFEVGNPY